MSQAICAVPSCARAVSCRGWCHAHYLRRRKTGDVQADLPLGSPPPRRRCSVEGCERDMYSRDLCGMHYKRRQRYGDVQADEPPRGTPVPCDVHGCENVATERGWCHGHYLRWARRGDVKTAQPLSRRTQPDECTVPGCNRPARTRGYCSAHYKRVLKYGHPRADVPFRIQEGQGGISHGYRNVAVPEQLRHLTNGEQWVGEHRLMMAQHLGRALYPDEVVHHRNGVRTDNRIENLQLWSTAHPKGQPVGEKIAYAVELLRRYAPDLLTSGRFG